MKNLLFFFILSGNLWAIQTGPVAKVSFVFHDSLASTYTKAAPIFAKYGLKATLEVLTGCIGMTTMPNTCKASKNRIYMTWDQVINMQRTYGWEIGSHTETHPLLVSTNAIDQPVKLTMDQVKNELVNSKSTLNLLNFDVYSFAPPYGDYDKNVIAEIAKSYSTMQGFWDTGYNLWPYDGMLIRTQQVQGGVSVATVKGYIDGAIANKQWLTLTFHEIKDKASAVANSYETSTSDLDSIVAYAKQKGIQVVTMTEGYSPSNPNLLSGGDFTTGLSTGWTTKFPSAVTTNAFDNGTYPSRKNSIRFISTTSDIHLFAPKVSINPTVQYLVKGFVNITKLTSGELFFYADEYNSAGAWISGKYLMGVKSTVTKNVSMIYSPSSTNVRSMAIQIGVKANSGITAFVDNISLSALDTNLLPNSGFDQGLTAGWTTNNSNTITLDSANNGSFPGPGNSIKLVGSPDKDFHLFSPKVSVNSATSYILKSFINIQNFNSGEIFFYVDEYNSNGDWISGKYLKGLRSTLVQNLSLIYSPSSAEVVSARFQIGVQVGSDITAFIDNIEFFALK